MSSSTPSSRAACPRSTTRSRSRCPTAAGSWPRCSSTWATAGCGRSRWTRPTAWPAASTWSTPAARSRCRSASGRSGGSSTCSGEPIDKGDPIEEGERWPIHREPPTFDSLSPTTEIFETGIKVVDLLAPYVEGRQGRALRRRRRRQDGADPGADQQHRPASTAASRCSPAWASARREGNDLWLEMTESGVHLSKTALVYGQMNEPPGARLRVGLVGPDDGGVLPRRARPGRAALHRQHLPLRAGGLRGLGAARAHAERRGLPADAGDRDGRSSRSASRRRTKGSITSVQAIYVPADDLTDPAPADDVRPPRCDDGALARHLREGHLPGRRSARLDLAHPRAGGSSARSTTASPRRCRRCSSATRTCRTSSPSWAWTSCPTRTS